MNEYYRLDDQSSYTTEQEQQEKAEFYKLVDMLETVSKDKHLTQLQAAEFSRLYHLQIGG